jgi:hypothetical protein
MRSSFEGLFSNPTRTSGKDRQEYRHPRQLGSSAGSEQSVPNQQLRKIRAAIALRIINQATDNSLVFLRYFPPEPSGVSLTPHSHSIVLSHDNALIFRRKIFLRATKNRLADPSKISALEFKGEFRRFGIWSISATISPDWAIFLEMLRAGGISSFPKKTVSDGEERFRL